jgi:hypothetical protein
MIQENALASTSYAEYGQRRHYRPYKAASTGKMVVTIAEALPDNKGGYEQVSSFG